MSISLTDIVEIRCDENTTEYTALCGIKEVMVFVNRKIKHIYDKSQYMYNICVTADDEIIYDHFNLCIDRVESLYGKELSKILKDNGDD